MKKLLLATAVLALCACGKDVIYDLPDSELFDNIYLVQAVDNPHAISMKDNFDGNVTKSFNAFFSGMSSPRDLHLTFEADAALIDEYNDINGTDMTMLPDDAFELVQTEATIKEGESKSSMIEVNFKVSEQMNIGVNYLLPIKFNLREKDVKVRKDLQVIYFNVILTKDFKPVVWEGDIAACDELFSFNDKCLIGWNGATGQLLRYPKVDGGFGKAEVLKDPSTDPYWASSYARMIFPCKGNTIHLVNVYGNWISIQANEDCSELKNVLEYSTIITGGCGIFLSCIPYCHPDGELIIDMATGGIRNYLLQDNGLYLTGALGFRSDFNYWPYALRFAFNDDIYGIDANGVLWRHEYNHDDFTYSSTPSQVGEGWNKFTHLVQFEDKLVARCPDGSLKCFDFDPEFFWDIKDLN
ncbi:MAG: DUF1735 domain-containing protein [Bacteroidales bacterium]|nr:DUF1735 domain-containing protein [Bacteroidales bacterium]